MRIIKRDGSNVEFDPFKIESAILKAMNETEAGEDDLLAYCITREISEKYASDGDRHTLPTVEIIQDDIEVALMKNRPDVAKQYILYRNERNRLRDQGWEMTDLQRDIYEQKYRYSNESFDEFLERVSGGNGSIKKLIRDKKFMPAGRILAGRGLNEKGHKVTLSNCYVLPKVEDSIESIFDTAKHLARTYSYGGGVGFNISNLRPKGAKVNNAANTTTGATSFMDLYSLITGLIGQNSRRGALMINMDVSHPDIEDFIDIKNDLSKVTSANISVNISDSFMEAVNKDEDFELYFKVDSTGEEISKIVNARDLFRKIAESNWSMAEPGMLFWNSIESWHLMSEDDEFEFAGVNPCAEETLPAFGSCNLSAINLSEFVINPFTDKAVFDSESFMQAVKEGVIYLNEILDDNMDNHPLEQQKEVARDLRQIGLGIMGLSDMFIKLGVAYGSEKSLEVSRHVASTMINSALQQSALLAKEYGTFPKYNKDAVLKSPFLKTVAGDGTMDLIAKHGLYNSQILTAAPTGSTSSLIGVSGGLEPIFQNSYTRKTETLHGGDTYYKVFTPIVKEFMEKHGLNSEEDLPNYFVTSSDIHYKDRIALQGIWQHFIDASISSTVNVSEEFTVEEVENLYMYAWEKGLKGVTIFRDNCARIGILTTSTEDKSSEVEEDDMECST